MKHVLIVEDDRLLALMLEDVLVQAGFEAEHAFDLAEADAAVVDSHIDAAILDVRIGDEQSYALARKLEDREIPYLFATSVNPADLPEDLRGHPVVDKPYTADQLLASVAALWTH